MSPEQPGDRQDGERPDGVRSRLRLTGRKDRLILVGALGVLSAVSPMATDAYLASMPRIAEHFGTSATAVQLTLATYMVGMAVGQFLLGPISDVLGRHRLMVAGNVLFLLSSVAVVLAPTIEAVIALRAVQGVAGAAGVVISRAIVSDMVSGREAAKLYSILSMIVSLAPAIAPLIGGLIATVAPWQAVFWMLAGFGLLMLVCSVVIVPETLPRSHRNRGGLAAVARSSWSVLRTPVFMAHAMTFALAFGSLFGYISASSFVYQNVIGMSALTYSVLFAVNACGSIVGAFVNTRLVDRFDPGTLLRSAVVVACVVNLAGLGLIAAGITGWTTLAQLFIGSTCIGFILGNAVALAQGHVAGRAGAGAAVLGLVQFLVGGLVSPLTGLGGEHTALPMAVVMAVCSTLALGTAFLARWLGRRRLLPH